METIQDTRLPKAKLIWVQWQGWWFGQLRDALHMERLDSVRDPLTIVRIKVSRNISCRELAKVRAAYNATFAPGVRNVWRTA